MAETDQDQKTEDPTGKRLDEARERGQLPISREVSAWVLFIAILIVVAWLGQPMATRLMSSLRLFLEMPHALNMEERGLQTLVYDTLLEIGIATVAIFALLWVAAIAGTMLQTGLFFSADLIQPNFDRLSWSRGLKKIFSTTALVELAKSFGKLVVLGILVFYTLAPVADDVPAFTGHPLIGAIEYLHKQAVHLLVMMLLVFTALAIADLVYQRMHYTKSLRMTKQEVKDEFKQQEGDPVIKNRLRQLRMEKARKRMMAQVPKADVVLTNPTHYSVALQYDNSKMAAPRVLAKGIDNVALRIRDVAEEHKIPTVSNPPLARVLYDTVEIDQEIPTQHYRAVAELISYVYKLKKKRF